jgi:hypothetical protein
MASPTAHAPHSGPVDQPGEGAYLWARSGIARSATTRSNYVSVQTSIDWIVRDFLGNIVSTTDLSGLILLDSLRISQAINDEPDTCSFTLRPQAAPATVPRVGQEIRIAWAPGASVLFHGFIVQTQDDWRANNLQPPWVAIQCQDPMWRFDARIVTYTFPAQSVSASIAFLVHWFCNSPWAPAGHPLDFSTAFVQPGMPSIPAFDVVNQRPSTVMRTLMASVGGGFYLEGFDLHAWAGSLSEPNRPDPQPLTVGLKTLHAFRRSEDATQLRHRVLVEGRRASTLIALPAMTTHDEQFLGVPLSDATIFPLPSAPTDRYLARLGTQWIYVEQPVSVTANGAQPPQGRVQMAFVPGSFGLRLDPIKTLPPPNGWIRVGNQYARYEGYNQDPLLVVWELRLVSAVGPGALAYGVLTEPIAVGETVEWVDAALKIHQHGLWFGETGSSSTGDDFLRAHPVDTPLVTLAVPQENPALWPEGFVQDGRYSYAGAHARAESDRVAFENPVLSVEWETDDLNALPGREQVIALSSAAVNPPINTTVTILRVELSFPLRTLPPRRRCTGGTVKPSTFLDLAVTEQN